MSLTTEELGRKLLGEVEEGDLSEILQQIWDSAQKPDDPIFNIPSLDRIIRAFRQNQLGGSSRQPVLELTSNTPAAGKTNLLYLLVAEAVLPQPPGAAPRKRPEPGTAIIIDTDNRFNTTRLTAILQTIHRNRNPPSDDRIEWTTASGLPIPVHHALRHVHILRPQSLASLIATIESVPSYLLDTSQHHSAHRRLSLLAIDSLTAFYWPERFERETAELPADDAASNERLQKGEKEKASPYARLSEAVRKVQEKLLCPVVATSWSFYSSTPRNQNQHTPGPGAHQLPSLRPLVGGSWNQLVTTRLVISREPVRKLASWVSLEQAERDKSQRQEVVERGRFRAEVDWWGADGWAEGVRERARRERGVGGFGFVIDGEGVRVDV